MLRLRLDTTYLDLGDLSLTITVHCPLFDQDGAEALYSFPFTLPATDHNLATLAHANRLDNSSNTTTYTGAVLEIEGVPFDHGILELDEQKFTAEGVGAIYKNSVPALLDALEKINIHEVLDTIEVDGGAPEAVWTFDQTAVAPALFIISIDGFSASYNPPGGTLPSAIAQELSDQINAEFPGMAFWAPGQEQIRLYSEQVNLHPVDLGLLNNLALDEVVTTAQSKQARWKNYLIDVNGTPVASHCFPMLRWFGFYKGTKPNPKFQHWINAQAGSDWKENLPYVDPAWEVTIVPFVRLPYIFGQVMEQTPGVLDTLAGYFDDADIQQLIVFNNRALDALVQDIYEDGELKYLNHFAETFDLNRHVPDMSGRELLRRFLDIFMLWYDYTGTTITFFKKREMIAGAPEDWTHLSEPGYQATRNKREGFTIEYEETEDLSTDPSQLQPYVSGEGKDEYILPFHSVVMANHLGVVGGGMVKVPTINQAGSSDEAGLGDNEFSFRLLFYRGLHPSSGAITYPLGSHDHTDYSDDPTGALSLDLNDPDGLYHQNHKGIAELLADGQPVTLPMRLSIHHILAARKWTNARRTIRLPEGQVTAVIKSIRFKATAQGLGISTVEFIQER